MKSKEEKLIDKIKALLNKSTSASKIGSIEEAELFARKAHELINKYNIDESLLYKEEDITDNYGFSEEIDYSDSVAGVRWKLALIEMLCHNNLCRFIWSSSKQTFLVYGKKEIVETVVWIYNYLSAGLSNVAQETWLDYKGVFNGIYKREDFLRDFLLGAVDGISQKLKTQKEEEAANAMREFQQLPEAEKSQSGLIRLTEMIKVNEENLNIFQKKVMPNLNIVKNIKPVKVYQGYGLGYQVGLDYNINPALEN